MLLLWNILLAFIWCLLQGTVDSATLAVGYFLGFLVLRISAGAHPETRYFLKPWKFIAFFLYFLREMHIAQFRVVYDVVTLRHRSNPGIIALPLDADTEAEIALLACIISLTPGTVALDVSPDRQNLFVHVMFIPEGGPDVIRAQLKDNLEKPLLELMR